MITAAAIAESLTRHLEAELKCSLFMTRSACGITFKSAGRVCLDYAQLLPQFGAALRAERR